MDIIKWIGIGLFLVGIIVITSYSLYPIYNENVEESTILSGVSVSVALMIVGSIILILKFSVERYSDYKKEREEFTKEDLKP